MKHSSFFKFAYRISMLVAAISLMGAFQVASAQKSTPRSTSKGINPESQGAMLAFAPSTVPSESDFTGDQLTDMVFLDPAFGKWVIHSSNGTVSSVDMGAVNATAVAADYDGDGIVDLASVYLQDGLYYWQVLQSSNSVETLVQWGIEGDTLVTGDFDGDGRADTGVRRQSDNVWYINGSLDGAMALGVGVASDIAVPGDYDGDGSTDVAAFNKTDRILTYFGSFDQTNHSISWDGLLTGRGETYVPADYDGDGKTDFAIFNKSEGIWTILESSTGSYRMEDFGIGQSQCETVNPNNEPCGGGDFPVAADYDNDGLVDPGVWNAIYSTIRAKGSNGDMKLHTEAISGMLPVSSYFMSK